MLDDSTSAASVSMDLGIHHGFLVQSVLAVLTGSRQVLGLAHQQVFLRQPAPSGETKWQREHRQREEPRVGTKSASHRSPKSGCAMDPWRGPWRGYLPLSVALSAVPLRLRRASGPAPAVEICWSSKSTGQWSGAPIASEAPS